MQMGFDRRALAPVLTVVVACIACGGSDTDAPPTQGTATGTGGSGNAGTGGSGGTGGAGASGGTGASSGDAAPDVNSVRDGPGAADRTLGEAGSGACTNAADQGIIGNAVKFEQDITECGTTCFFLPGDKAACASDCMRGKGLSSGCAVCYGGQIACGMVTCSAPCMVNSSSTECRMCVMQNCEPPFRACAGVPPAGWR